MPCLYLFRILLHRRQFRIPRRPLVQIYLETACFSFCAAAPSRLRETPINRRVIVALLTPLPLIPVSFLLRETRRRFSVDDSVLIALCRPVCTIRGIVPYEITFTIPWELLAGRPLKNPQAIRFLWYSKRPGRPGIRSKKNQTAEGGRPGDLSFTFFRQFKFEQETSAHLWPVASYMTIRDRQIFLQI